MNQILFIDGEHCFVDCPERFALLLEEKLGSDAAGYFRDFASNDRDGEGCTGECDVTYRMHEHYERVISDVIDDLRNGVGSTKIIRRLRGELVLPGARKR